MADPAGSMKANRLHFSESTSGCGCLLLVIGITIALIFIVFGDEIPSNVSLLFFALSGKEVSLKTNALDARQVLLGSTELDYDEGNRAIRIHDHYGYDELLRTGRIFLVLNGTKALIIDRGVFVVRVRILEGKDAGQSGWLPLSHIELRSPGT